VERWIAIERLLAKLRDGLPSGEAGAVWRDVWLVVEMGG
jgi:hypothetical protein